MKKILVLLLLLSLTASAGLPPTTAQDSSDSSGVTTFFYNFPNFTGTHTGVKFSLGVNSVAGGGTGQTTFTANHPLLGNGSSALTQGTLSGNTTEFGTVSGSLTTGDCLEVDSNGNIIDAGLACGQAGPYYAESPATGTVNGTNTVFTTSHVPYSQASLHVFLDGLNIPSNDATYGWTLTSSTVTFNTAPVSGQILYFWYPTSSAGSGGGITSLSGDVVATGPGSVAATIQPGVVTLAKQANLAADSVIGNSSGSAATPQALAFSYQDSSNTIVSRDPFGNSAFNNVYTASNSVTSSNQTINLTTQSNQYQIITGTANVIFGLPVATTILPGVTYYFNNNSTGTVYIEDAGANPLFTMLPGAYTSFTLTNNSTTDGSWDWQSFVPNNSSWGTGGLTLGGGLFLSSNVGAAYQITNSSSGTTLNELAILNSSGQAVTATTSSTTGVIGVVIGGAGTSGSADIGFGGQQQCVFDGATTAGDYVQASTSTAGDCHDAGSTFPTVNQTLGRVLSTNGSAGTYYMILQAGEVTIPSGAVTIGTIDSQTAQANGLYASGNVIYPQSASTSVPGMVNTTTQSFAGAKQFSGSVSFPGGTTTYDSGFILEHNGDASRKLEFTVPTTTSVTTTIAAGAQTASSTFTFPVSTSGDTLVAAATTQTLSQKEYEPRVNANSAANSITPALGSWDIEKITLSSGTAFTVNNATGTLYAGDRRQFWVTATSSGAITYSWGTSYIGSGSLPLPSTCPGGAASKQDWWLFQYDGTSLVLLAYICGR